MKNFTWMLAATLAVAGCQKAPPPRSYADASAVTADAPGVEALRSASSAPKASNPVGSADAAKATAPKSPNAAMLAYAYGYTMEAPAKQIAALLHKHEHACSDAGPALCQVLGETTAAVGADETEGRLDLRADPTWLARFRAELETDAKQAGGRIADSKVETEDLSRSIVDSEAMLRSKRALRDRLQSLLTRASSGIKDLLATEEELARVQGEIDAGESELAVMRDRVQMSKLSLSYRSISSLAPNSAFRPVQDAAHSALHTLMVSLGLLVTLIAAVAPFAAVAGLGFWLWSSRRPKSVGKGVDLSDGRS